MIIDDHNRNHNNNTVTATGCYFMDNNDGSSSSVKAKIMAHPHYHRLLAAYANCQKVKNEAEFPVSVTLLTKHPKPIYLCFFLLSCMSSSNTRSIVEVD
jgi:hypothetical protein